ncbi:MAG: hypothetical protein QOC95_1555 [Thermoleophilaceae bacterium]|nr:hypothetical protein [Thermoleophilaceae bacterium]
MRKLLLGAITGAVMLAVAAIAMAATDTTYSQKYTSPKVSTSVGTNFSTTSIDNENTAGNNQPAAAREVDITFPKGTLINQTAAPFCKNLDESADNPCPTKTKIGGGSAEVRLKFNGTAPIPASVTAYNRKGGLFLYVVPSVQGQAPVVLKPVFKGITLVTKIAPLCVLNDCATNGEAVLTKFKLNTKAIKKGTKTFIKSPAKCPKAGWQFIGTFKYDAPTPVKKLSSLQKCKK